MYPLHDRYISARASSFCHQAYRRLKIYRFSRTARGIELPCYLSRGMRALDINVLLRFYSSSPPRQICDWRWDASTKFVAHWRRISHDFLRSSSSGKSCFRRLNSKMLIDRCIHIFLCIWYFRRHLIPRVINRRIL